MTTRLQQLFSVAALAVALPLMAAPAQFPSEVVGFNGPPIGDPLTSQEMFQAPEFSGTTADYIVPNSGPGVFDFNAAFRASGLQTEGAASMRVFFKWISLTDPDAWVRLSTFNGAVRPNPALDTRGMVRFKFNNLSELFAGGAVGVCLGIRETGVDAAQLRDGGTTGPIEWVGVDTTVNGITAGTNGIVDTEAAGDDVQEYPVGFDIIGAGLPSGTAVISPGPDGDIDTTPDGDDEDRFGYFIGTNGQRVPIPAVIIPTGPLAVAMEWDLATGNVFVGGVNRGGGIASFTGDGVLNPPNDRGTLEHVAITKVPTDTADDIDFGIDELQFEATVPDPVSPPTIVAPVFEGDEQVQIQATPGATETELFVNDQSVGTATPSAGGLSVHPVSGLIAGDLLTATQTKDGMTSDYSAPVVVFAAGVVMADNFDNYDTPAELNDFWFDSITSPNPPEAKVRLQPGGAASCPNFLREENPPASNAARLYRPIGSVDGSDTDPLWVTWNFRFTGASGSNSRTRFELAHFDGGPFGTGARGEGTAGITLFNQVAGDLFTQYNLTLRVTENQAVLDELLAGGWTDSGGFLRAPSGVTRVPDVWHKMQIEVRTAVLNYYIDGLNVNPPGFESGVPRPSETDFTHVIIGEGFSNNGPMMMFDNVSVTTGAGGSGHPFSAPEPPAPKIVEPLVPEQDTVTVTDVDTTGATQVRIFADGSPIADVMTSGFASPTIEIDVDPPLSIAQDVTATQVISGEESCKSIPVTVAVPVPVVMAPLFEGGRTIHVSNVHPSASMVTVYVGDDPTSVDPGGMDAVDVTVSPLAFDDEVVATQTIAGFESAESDVVVVLAVDTAFCQTVFVDEFDTDSSANWIVNTAGETRTTFDYDYSADGIPPSPSGGGTTLGVKFEVNMTSGATAAITMAPVGFSFAGDYRVKFDMWINANGPFPSGGVGSTEYLTSGVGYDGATVNLGGTSGIGAWFAPDGEGGSTRDWRGYKNAGEQFVASGQYLVDTNNNSGADLSSFFAPQSPPQAQQDAAPDQQTGQTAAGCAGFAWRDVDITVNAADSTVEWKVDGLPICRLVCDGSVGAACAITGNISIGYMDIFASVSDGPQFSFGIVDNVRVLIEPASVGSADDWDNDGDVDARDFEAFAQCLGGPSVDPSPLGGVGCADECRVAFDFDGDDDIDLVDFGEFQRNYNP